MHLLVLSAFRRGMGHRRVVGGCVSMHLLVLSAFRPSAHTTHPERSIGLNAPFGAQCFPTARRKGTSLRGTCLNAPFGAQCFPTDTSPSPGSSDNVSMHLLVLSAFRQNWHNAKAGGLYVSMHLLVLSAFRHAAGLCKEAGCMSQCTFWCSVLSDSVFSIPVGLPDWGLNAPFGAQCFPTSMSHSSWVATASLNAPFGAQCFPT